MYAAITVLRILVFLGGLLVVIATINAAIKTFVVPRGINVGLTSAIFRFMGGLFRLRTRKVNNFEERDRIMAMFAPLTLVLIPVVFLTLILLGYAAMYWALEPAPLSQVFKLSGSSLLTLGYASVEKFDFKLLEFSEAMIGLIMVALLIAYLPAIYAAFAKRETAVALLEGYAGAPPSPVEMISRLNRTNELGNQREFWADWQTWFAEVEESHTSLAPLAFFRSPQPSRSWITAAGAVLDAAALTISSVDVPWEPRAALCIRSGYIALRQIANFFNISYEAHPAPTDPISISREEFDMVWKRLQSENVPLKADKDQAWRDFAGWRVNYDNVLLSLAALTIAPYALWSSDRSPVGGFGSRKKNAVQNA